MYQGQGFGLLILGGFVSLLNVYLSLLRVPLLRACGQSPRHVSVLPAVGSLLLVTSALLLWGHWRLVGTALVLAAIDTGGLLWAFVAILREACASLLAPYFSNGCDQELSQLRSELDELDDQMRAEPDNLTDHDFGA